MSISQELWDEETPYESGRDDLYEFLRGKTAVIHLVTNYNFAEFLLRRPVAVLYLWACWEKSDQFMKYRIGRLAEMHPDVTFGIMDVDREANMAIVKILNVQQVPSTLFFVRGNRHDRLLGVQTLSSLSKHVRHAMKEANRLGAIRKRMVEYRQLQRG